MKPATREKPPSARGICRAHPLLVQALRNVADGKADVSCWACGETGPGFVPERAHVVPHSAGGSNDASNFILLCPLCHREHPDAQSWPTQRAWLLSRPSAAALRAQAWAPVAAACELEAACRGRPEALVEWSRAHGPEALQRTSVASAGGSNVVANWRWSIFEAFVAWLDATEPKPR